jgi:hypothetical protein
LPMRLRLFSFALVLTLGLNLPVHSAPVPEPEPQREAYLMWSDTLHPVPDPLSVAFRLPDWLEDTGSGGFPAGFSDDDRPRDQWEEPAE